MSSPGTDPGLGSALGSFVPAGLLHRLRRLQPGPAHVELSAAVVRVEVPGLERRLAEAFDAESVTTEALRPLIEDHIGRLVRVVVAHGGEVLLHSRQSLLGVWQADGDLEPAALRAAACARELVDAGGAPDVLHPAATVGAGPLSLGRYGGEGDRWVLVPSGPALGQVLSTSGQVPSGGVMLSAECRSLLGTQVRGIAQRGGRLLLESLDAVPGPPPADADRGGADLEQSLRRHVPAVVQSRLADAELQSLTELRRLTVIEVRVLGLDPAEPKATDRLQALVQLTQADLHRRGGTLLRVVVELDGVSLRCVFGLPPANRQPVADEAVHFAVALGSALGEAGMQRSAGISTGKVFSHAVGIARRREYVLTGPTVLTARQLCRDAQGGVVVDQDTRSSAWSGVRYESLPPLHYTVLSAPVMASRVVGVERRGPGPEPGAELVGRDEALAWLRSAVDTLGRGEGPLVLLEGPPGVGKTLLTSAAAAYAQSRGVRVVQGRADPVGLGGAYTAWRGVIRGALGLDEAADDEERSQRLRSGLAQLGADFALAPLLNPATGLDLEESEVTWQMTGSVRAEVTDDLLLGLLKELAAEGPVLVLLGDAHWFDSATWRLALRLAKEGGPCGLIITSREPRSGGAAERDTLFTLPGLRHRELHGLDTHATEVLMGRVLGVARLPEALVSWTQSTTQGNPYFAQELTRSLWEQGVVGVEEGELTWWPSQQELEVLPLPPSLEAVVTGRLDRLSDELQIVLQSAAAIGHFFEGRVLEEICPVVSNPEDLQTALGALERAGLIGPVVPSARPTYAFRQRTVQEAAYERAPPTLRRDAHRAIAEWYERHEAHALDAHYPVLVHHFSRAEDNEKSLAYLELAGAQAWRRGSHREAVGFFGGAIERDARTGAAGAGWPASVRRSRWRRQLADALFGLGELERCAEECAAALTLLGHRMPTGERGWRWLYARQAFRQTLHLVLPRWLLEAREAAQDRFFEGAMAAERLAERFLFSAEPVALVAASLLSVNLAERAGRQAPVGRSYAMVGMVSGFTRLHRLAGHYFRRAERVAEDTGDRPALAVRHYAEGTYRLGRCEWEGTEEALNRAHEIALDVEDMQEVEASRSLLASFYLARGRLAEAGEISREILATARERSNVQHEVWGLNVLAQTLIYQGHFDDALEVVEQARAMADQADFPSQIATWGLLASAHLHRREVRSAMRAAEEVVTRIRQATPLVFATHAGIFGAAEVYLDAWSRAREVGASNLAQVAAAAQRTVKDPLAYSRLFPIGRPRALVFLGRAQWLNGREAQAEKTLHKGLAEARRLRVPFDEALALRELAIVSGDGTLRTEAQEIFVRIGSDWR